MVVTVNSIPQRECLLKGHSFPGIIFRPFSCIIITSVEPHFMNIHLIQTPHYHGQFFGPIPYILFFLKINPIKKDTVIVLFQDHMTFLATARQM